MKIELSGIIVSVITAIGIAIYQVKASKQKAIDKRKSKSYQEIWDSINNMRIYYDIGMQKELQTIGTLKLEPILKFRIVVNESKSNIDFSLYNELVEFYERISSETNSKIFSLMKSFFNNKKDLFPNELKDIETKVNTNRIKILNEIELFMKTKNKELQ